MNWRDVPIPERMKNLKKTPSGIPIPVVILIDKNGTAQFKVNDSTVAEYCLEKNMCGICGEPMGRDKWLIGGPKAAFHQRGAYVDTPMHYECSVYSLKVCPYLSKRNYNLILPEDDPKLKRAEFKDEILLYNPTQDMTQPDEFVLIKIKDIVLNRPSVVERYIIPVRPYLAVEFWANGEQIPLSRTKKETRELYKQYFNNREIKSWL